MSQLVSIQACFAADLIGVKSSSSHPAILRELGWNTLSSTTMKRKLLFWARLAKLNENTWANKALREYMSAQKSGGWKSDYRMEIQKLHTECRIGNILKNGQTPENTIKQAIKQHDRTKLEATLTQHRSHSLKYFPNYPDGMGRQKYIKNTEASSTLAKFRLGDTDLGNRLNPPVLICPACKTGPNNELHLVFQCPAMSHLRQEMKHILEEANDQQRFSQSDNRKLCSFLGQDQASPKVLQKRGTYLSILLDKFRELTSTKT